MTARPSSISLETAMLTGQTCACFNLRRASRVITQLYDEALRPLGIRVTQFTLLTAIRSLGPVPINDLAQTLAMDRTTLTRNLKPLAKEGLVESRPGSDRRVRELLLTDHGHETLSRAYPVWKETQEAVAQLLGRSEMEVLLSQLKATVDAVRGSGADSIP